MRRSGVLRVLLFAWPAFAVTASHAQDEDPAVAPVPIELPALLLESITLEGNTPRLQDEEFDAFYSILDRARRVDQQRLQAAARDFLFERRATYSKWRDKPIEEFPTFVDLFKNPQAYHGKPVTLSGHVRKYSWAPAEPNPGGIDTLHEIWLFTDRSQSNPIVVTCTSIPDDFPTDAELIEHVTVTGYFFKMYVYEAQDAYRVAPMVLAGRLEWRPSPESGFGPVPPWVYVVVAVLLACVVVCLWRASNKDRTLYRKHARMDDDAENVDLQGLSVDENSPANPFDK